MENKKAGQWDLSGQCIPGEGLEPHAHTFSLGIFKWVEKIGCDGIKKSKVAIRISGARQNPNLVFDKAEKICKALNSGKSVGDFPKHITVR
ncbi:MAG: hypothetical protein A2161_13755 [Candidatus Schekmanbacteria bacterium RBG_13_48_7]|uniref:Uncharacterized protein n=1 Tax=Candidatus Schekmanbacteria bacterium RBG_13_48_7 TaxID=1817878 RepID=A0A1F7RZJ6_9BACT|nr:MAG: hypothetical protein A2161_13755 [Candidatus Schekmanbacteria bacterium RBG_13_48_7]